MGATYEETPPELIFPPQWPFSWTLRGAWARRRRAEQAAAGPVLYRIAGTADDAADLAAAMAFCREHKAVLDLA
jgi:hypothetical protein